MILCYDNKQQKKKNSCADKWVFISERIKDSLKWFIQADWFIQEWNNWLCEWVSE